jgi:hypothetical protein
MSAVPALTDFDDASSYSQLLTDELMFGDGHRPLPEAPGDRGTWTGPGG